MLIFITGYMGAGKTTFAKKLAGALNYSFLDLDELIETNTGKTITEIFETMGEEAFRETERQVLTDLFNADHAVIATGGGTPCYGDNMSRMNSSGLTVFLDTPQEVILSRLEKALPGRPLLQSLRPTDLPEFFHAHMRMRRPYYEQAAITIDHDDPALLISTFLKKPLIL